MVKNFIRGVLLLKTEILQLLIEKKKITLRMNDTDDESA